MSLKLPQDKPLQKYGRYIEYWGVGSDSGVPYWVWKPEAYKELSGKELEDIRLDLAKSYRINARHGNESVTSIVDRAFSLESRINKLEKEFKKI